MKVPWTARISNQAILKEIRHEYSLEGLMLKLKLQYFGHLMGRADTVEKTLMLGKIEGGREGYDPQDSQESSPTPHSKASILRHSAFFIVQLSHPHVTARKTIALTRQTIGKVMSLLFPRQTIHYHSNPSLCPNQQAEEAEVEQFYEDLQDFQELTPKKDVLFIIGDWNAKVGS